MPPTPAGGIVGPGKQPPVVNYDKQYQDLTKALTDEWGLGAKVLRKNNIAPYLKQFEGYMAQVKEFDRLRTEYVGLGDRLRMDTDKAREAPDPMQYMADADKIRPEWLRVGGQITEMGKDLPGMGARVEKSLAGFDKTVVNLLDNLKAETDKVWNQHQNLSPKQQQAYSRQRTAMRGLVSFLEKAQTNFGQYAKQDFGALEKMVDEVKNKNPVT